MSKPQHYDNFNLDEELAEFDNLPSIRNIPGHKLDAPKGHRHKPKPTPAEIDGKIAAQADDQESFSFTYKASRHESTWLLQSLGDFYEGQWISDVLRLLKGGKEASVYQCSTNPATGVQQPYLAAKVYRPRMLRNLRNDHLYREGRSELDIEGRNVLDGGMLHAMRKRSNYGLDLLHTSWIGHEVKTMQILHAAGVDLPMPYAIGENAILMAYIGGPDMPAPTLNSVELSPEEAQDIYDRVVWNIDLMLTNRRVHGDLSAYNLLYWDGQVQFIDFPQAIDPTENRNAYRIFERDIRRTCEYFKVQGVRVNPEHLAKDLWTAHGFRLQPEVHPRLLDDQDEADRHYWQNLLNT